MQWVDWVIFGYTMLGLLAGLRRGLMLVGFSLAGYVVGIVVATQYQTRATATVLKELPLQAWLAHILPAPVMASSVTKGPTVTMAHTLVALLVFLVIVGLVESIGRVVGGVFTEMVRTTRITGSLNQLGGAAAGMAEHLLIIGLAISVLAGVPYLSQTPLMLAVHHSALAGTISSWYGQVIKIPVFATL